MLKVLAAYARDVGRGVVRIDHQSMDSLGVSTGDTIEIIGKKDGMDAKCYPLLPSDEGQGITRIDPEIRKIIGAMIDDTVTIRQTPVSSVENFAAKGEEPGQEQEHGDAEQSTSPPQPEQPASIESPASADMDEAAIPYPKFILSGSSMDFEKERPNLVAFIAMLETAAHSKSSYKCYSDGKKALGWDFFLLEMSQEFVDKLRDVYPDIDKQEAGTTEERLAIWMNKQLKKSRMDFHLKLNDVPQEKVKGFKLDPKYYRDKTDLEDLR